MDEQSTNVFRKQIISATRLMDNHDFFLGLGDQAVNQQNTSLNLIKERLGDENLHPDVRVFILKRLQLSDNPQNHAARQALCGIFESHCMHHAAERYKVVQLPELQLEKVVGRRSCEIEAVSPRKSPRQKIAEALTKLLSPRKRKTPSRKDSTITVSR